MEVVKNHIATRVKALLVCVVVWLVDTLSIEVSNDVQQEMREKRISVSTLCVNGIRGPFPHSLLVSSTSPNKRSKL